MYWSTAPVSASSTSWLASCYSVMMPNCMSIFSIFSILSVKKILFLKTTSNSSLRSCSGFFLNRLSFFSSFSLLAFNWCSVQNFSSSPADELVSLSKSLDSFFSSSFPDFLLNTPPTCRIYCINSFWVLYASAISTWVAFAWVCVATTCVGSAGDDCSPAFAWPAGSTFKNSWILASSTYGYSGTICGYSTCSTTNGCSWKPPSTCKRETPISFCNVDIYPLMDPTSCTSD